jgi:hypothetical protein
MGRRRKSELNKSFMTNSNDSSDSSAQSNSLNGQQRKAANDRERTRMRVLSKAFVRLKTSLPWVPNDTKLSKLDTLKLAASYIAYLTKILEEDGTVGTEIEGGGEDMDMFEYAVGNENNTNSSNNNASNPDFNSFYQMCHQSSKMLSCITLSSLDTQRTISEHLAATNHNFYTNTNHHHQNHVSFNVA